jgi:hypothetical protein
MNLPKKSHSTYTKEAKALAKLKSISHSAALNILAQKDGFPNWKALIPLLENKRALKPPIPKVSTNFINNDEVILTPEESKSVERAEDLPEEIKSEILLNKKYFISIGVQYSIFEPTITGLKKSILDATQEVRTHFELEGFHSYISQSQGTDYKLIKDAFFVFENETMQTKVSLYRPETKKGDPRMWFSKLGDFAKPTDQIAIVIFNEAAYLFNFSKYAYYQHEENSFSVNFLRQYSTSKNSVADGLLAELRKIAKAPIRSISQGPTAIGEAVESALKILKNSDKKPDYKGIIEIKSGRGGKNRTTLFAQVADWSISSLKSSAEILDAYGYKRGDDDKLYCTVSAQRANSQGLKFFYSEATDQLIEQDSNGKNVAIWSGAVLRKRLLEKHSETFWVEAKSIKINDIEYFTLHSVIHTKQPIISQLLPLIESGVITMDHLIKRKGGLKPTVTEKGPLFKLNKKDLVLLFPEPKKYNLA